jgi:hypothetical protein
MALTMMALLCAVAMGGEASAQLRGRNNAPNSGGTSDDLPPSVPPPLSTLPPRRGVAGPKLSPGAVVCRSEFDLEQRAAVNSRRLQGDLDAGNPLENCQMITQDRGVEIVARHGMGKTEVKLKPSGEVGWTDSYMPP